MATFERIIVKIQVPLETNDPDPKALVYNEARSVDFAMPINKQLLGKMSGAKKQFFYANLEKGILDIDRKAPWQDW